MGGWVIILLLGGSTAAVAGSVSEGVASYPSEGGAVNRTFQSETGVGALDSESGGVGAVFAAETGVGSYQSESGGVKRV